MCRDKTHIKGVWCGFSIEHILCIYSQCAAAACWSTQYLLSDNSQPNSTNKLPNSRSKVLPEKITGPHFIKKFPTFFWTPKVYYCIHNCLPTVPTVGHINPVCLSPSHFLKIHFIISFHLFTFRKSVRETKSMWIWNWSDTIYSNI